MPVGPFTGGMAQSGAHCTIFATDEFGVLYEELGVKMEAFLNSAVNISALQVSAGTFVCVERFFFVNFGVFFLFAATSHQYAFVT